MRESEIIFQRRVLLLLSAVHLVCRSLLSTQYIFLIAAYSACTRFYNTNKHLKQWAQKRCWSSWTIAAFVLWISAFVLRAAFFLSSYRLAAQSPVFLVNGPLYGDTEQRLCCSLFLPLVFFFSFTLWQCPLTATLTSQEAKWASQQCFIQQDHFWNWEGIVGGSPRHQVCSQRERGEGTRWVRSATVGRQLSGRQASAGLVRLCVSWYQTDRQ